MVQLVKGLILYKPDGTVVEILQPMGDGNRFNCRITSIVNGKLKHKQRIMYAYNLLKLKYEEKR